MLKILHVKKILLVSLLTSILVFITSCLLRDNNPNPIFVLIWTIVGSIGIIIGSATWSWHCKNEKKKLTEKNGFTYSFSNTGYVGT